MITINRYDNLGFHDFGWLQARYHFSFGQYHNPQRMGFGVLRVINDDIIAPHMGFNTHPHDNMEIITYVRQGAITHTDSEGHEGKTIAGNVQVMSAGSGIEHSEHNKENEETHLFQIWIKPRERNVTPRWEARDFPQNPAHDHVPLLVSGFESDKDKALYIHQDACIYGGKIAAGSQFKHAITNQAYVLVSEGEITLNGHTLQRGDSAEIIDTDMIEISTHQQGADILIIDIPNT